MKFAQYQAGLNLIQGRAPHHSCHKGASDTVKAFELYAGVNLFSGKAICQDTEVYHPWSLAADINSNWTDFYGGA